MKTDEAKWGWKANPRGKRRGFLRVRGEIAEESILQKRVKNSEVDVAGEEVTGGES